MRFTIPLLALLGTNAALADGATTFAQFCATCHGAGGKGDGIVATALPVKPADFTTADFWATRDDAHVTKVIKEGGPAVGKSPMMAPWGGVLSDAQIAELVAYLKTLK
jgi:mono/diheme cytochrome c family protein